MTKLEYMRRLQEKLDNFSKELREDILEDYHQHFAEGELQGKTDEEIIAELGNIEDMVRELSESELKENMVCGMPGGEGLSRVPVQECQKTTGTGMCAGDGTENGGCENRPGNAAQEGPAAQEGNSYHYSGKYKKVVLEGEEADIYLMPSEDEEIHVEYINRLRNGQEKYECYQYEEGDVFYAGIQKRKDMKKGRTGEDGDEKSWKVMLFGKTVVSYKNIGDAVNGQTLALYVSVPKGVRELSVKASSGDVQIQDLVQENILLESCSGDVKVLKSLANIMKLHTSSGDLAICETKCCQCLNVSTSSGDVNIQDVVMKERKAVFFSEDGQDEGSIAERELIVKSSSGDVTIKNVTAEKIDVFSSSGDAKLQNVTAAASNVRSASGDVSIDHIDCSRVMQVESSKGDLAVADVKAEAFNVGCSAGDVAVSSVKFTSGNIETSSGDLAISDMEFTSGNFKTNSGDMVMANLQFGTGKFMAVQGDIVIANMKFEAGNFVAKSGDIVGSNLCGEFGSFSTERGDIGLQDPDGNHCRGYQCVSESGDINVESGAEIYECRSRAGDISVRAFGAPRKLTIESKEGDVSVNAKGTPESISLKSNGGDAKLTLDEAEGMDVEIQTVNGDAYIKWDGHKRNVGKGNYTYGTGACKVEVFSGDGDLVISGLSD